MQKFIFDIETTGLPERKGFDFYYDPKEIDKYSGSRIVQIAFILVQGETETKRFETKIKPDNFQITNSEIHGITQDIATKEGKTFSEVATILFEELKNCDTIVSHNIKFDNNILLSECYRYNQTELIEELKKKIRFCTMAFAKEKLGLRKYPKLKDLYERLTNSVWNQKHEALDDTIACKECYLKLQV